MRHATLSLKSGLALLPAVALLAVAAIAPAAENDWAEGTAAGSDGATRDYYNRAGLLAWNHFLGDWRDAQDRSQGDRAYATATVEDDDSQKPVEWEVTLLVRQWLGGTHQNQGFFLRTLDGGGTIVFASRQATSADRRPQLVVSAGAQSVVLTPQADTHLDASTYRNQGTADVLRVSGRGNHALLRFDLSSIEKLGPNVRARLRLFSTKQYGAATIGVFRCAQGHDAPPVEPREGLAAKYRGDRGISQHPSVLLCCDFESAAWAQQWTHAAPKEMIDTVDRDAPRKFESLQGKALRSRIAEGSHTALNTLFKFAKETGFEPEEIYFRYYLRLGDDWNQTTQGGKMPGISGTYGIAGWGGRKSDGTDGWSARGLFHLSIPADNPLAGRHPIGTYCYHADMQGQYGSHWLWQQGYRGYLEENRWYCIEQYLRLNTPGEKNGILKAWVDGRPAFEKTDIRFRLVDRLKIEQIWMNVYHGGKQPSPHDQHVYIDNVVVAKEYVGPMGTKE